MRIALLALLLVITGACSTSRRAAPAAPAAVIPLDFLPALAGGYFEQPSDFTGRRYHIYVRLPAHYADAPATARYPVVFLLDGDSLFPILAAEHLFLTIDDETPEAIIVGIAYGSFDPSINKRDHDFVAPGDGSVHETVGAPAFLQFLRRELVPAVEAKYRTDPVHRILFGQSLGGSFVLYSAFSDPDFFWGRIAVNPSRHFMESSYDTPAPTASRPDLALVVTSGTHDQPARREATLRWFKRWGDGNQGPWAIKTLSIEGGTHSADSSNAYRAGIEWLLARIAATP